MTAEFIRAACVPDGAHASGTLQAPDAILAISPPVLALAQRARTEMSEWTPHRSREIIDVLHDAAGER